MFDRIAHRYDLLNRVLSFGQDLAWRRRAVALAAVQAGDRALDVGAGTGDLALALAKAGPSGRVVALDIAPVMLARARRRSEAPLLAVLGSAEALPFGDAVFSAVVAGFAVRNFGDPARGLAEMRRVLRPAGRAVVLELAVPTNRIAGALHLFYLHRVSPLLAAALGSSPEAYRYLPASIERFPSADRLAAAMRDVGFSAVRYERLTFGAATIHFGEA